MCDGGISQSAYKICVKIFLRPLRQLHPVKILVLRDFSFKLYRIVVLEGVYADAPIYTFALKTLSATTITASTEQTALKVSFLKTPKAIVRTYSAVNPQKIIKSSTNDSELPHSVETYESSSYLQLQ